MKHPLPDEPQYASSADDTRDERLMVAIRGNDAGSLDELLRLYWRPIVGYATSLLGNQDAAEDIAQQTFVQLWQRRAAWRSEGTVRGYLYRVARNLVLSDKRRQAVRSRWGERFRREEQRRPLTPEQHVLGSELEEAVESALSALPERRREVFELVRFHSLSYKEVAEAMGISPQTVANQMSAALRSLRECLSSYEAEPTPPTLRILPPTRPTAPGAPSSVEPKRRSDH